MSSELKGIWTAKGLDKLAAFATGGPAIQFQQAAIGDGGGVVPAVSPGQTSLVHEVWRGNVTAVYEAPAAETGVVVEILIPNNVGGFIIREWGLFDAAGELLVVGPHAEFAKPVLESGSAAEIMEVFRLPLTNASAVSLVVDSRALATRKYVDDEADAHIAAHEAKSPAHPAGKISYNNTASGLAATQVQAAVDELQTGVAAVADSVSAHKAESGAHPAAKVSYNNTASGLAATQVQAAVDELQTGVAAVANSVSTHKAESGAHTAAKISYNNTASGLAATQVQAAVDELQTVIANSKRQVVKVFTSSGTYNKPAGLIAVEVELWGGGGGGGRNGSYGGGGGGGGGYCRKRILASAIGASETVTIGAAGLGATAAAADGGDGGTTRIGAHCYATGGEGGAGTAASNRGGNSGAGSGGNVNSGLGRGHYNVTAGAGTVIGGDGGGPNGGAGRAGGTDHATHIASGGGGGKTDAGGNGSAGLCVICEYFA